MGFRFRKSVKIGPFRMTASKSGLSYSVGTKGARITKTAKGKARASFSVPGTGLSYSTQLNGKKAKRKAKRPAAKSAGAPVPGEVEAAQRTPAQNIRGAGLVFIFGGVAIGFKALLFGVVVAVAGVALFAGAQRISGLLWPEDGEDEGDGSDGEV